MIDGDPPSNCGIVLEKDLGNGTRLGANGKEYINDSGWDGSGHDAIFDTLPQCKPINLLRIK